MLYTTEVYTHRDALGCLAETNQARTGDMRLKLVCTHTHTRPSDVGVYFSWLGNNSA